MNSKLKVTLIFMLALALVLAIYGKFRWPQVEKGYTSRLSEKVESMRPVTGKIRTDTQPEALVKFFNELVKNDSAIAAIAVSDSSGSVKQVVKNDSLIHSGATLDKLLQSIRDLGRPAGDSASKGISFTTEKRGRFFKYYIYSYNTGNIGFMAVYVFRPGLALSIRIILELLLAVSACIMLAAYAAISGRKKWGQAEEGKPVVQKSYAPIEGESKGNPRNAKDRQKKEMNPVEHEAVKVDESELFATKYAPSAAITADAAVKTEGPTVTVSNSLDNTVFGLFTKIYRELSPSSVSLYIKRDSERLSKSYELKGKTFLRVDAPVLDSILIDSLAEAKRPGAHIIDNGMQIRIPLFDSDALIGLVEIFLKESATALDISRIQNEVKETSRQIKEFIVINNVIVDPETGYFSSSYLSMKLGEQIYSSVKHGTHFCLMVADIFGEQEIDSAQKNVMLKVLLPAVKKATGDKYELFNTGYRIAVILEGTGENEAEKTRRALEREITRYRMKLQDNRIFRLTPVVKYTMSSGAGNLNDILQETITMTEKFPVAV